LDHKFSAEHGILSQAAEFSVFFWRMLRNLVLAGNKGTSIASFGRVQGPYKINCYLWAIGRGGEPWNLANWPMEFGKICSRNCGP